MNNNVFIQLALETLSCTQKELALQLGVSPTQITKWKQGEYMSSEMAEKFRGITNIGNRAPEFVVLAGSLNDAIKWEKLIEFLAHLAHDGAETGYDTSPLIEDLEFLCWDTFDTLQEMGVSIPKSFPEELELKVDYEDENFDEEDLLTHPLVKLIHDIYLSFNNVYGFYVAYVRYLMYADELDFSDTSADNIDLCLMSLAACKIDVSEELAPNFRAFRYKLINDYREWLSLVKEAAYKAGVPLKAELMDLVNSPDYMLRDSAERESLGFNTSQVHPDIYMNELLMKVRDIHKALPVIMKKLGINSIDDANDEVNA